MVLTWFFSRVTEMTLGSGASGRIIWLKGRAKIQDSFVGLMILEVPNVPCLEAILVLSVTGM